MSIQPKLLISVGATLAALVGVFAFLFVRTAGEGAYPSVVGLDERLDRTSVRLHRALRAKVAHGGHPFAARLELAASEPAEAEALARSLLGDLKSDISDDGAPMLGQFGGPELDPAMDRLHLALAMLWSERHPERSRRVPTYAFLYETLTLEGAQLDQTYAGLAHAVRAFAYASAGHCDLVEPLDAAAPESLEHPIHLGGETQRRFRLLQRFLVDGSLACCVMRSDRLDETVRLLEQSITDAEHLEISSGRLRLLRAWTGVLKGEKEQARAELDALHVETLHDDDQEAYRIVRSALANDDVDAATRARLGTTRVEWLTRLVVASALEAVQGSELEEPLWTSEAARAAQRFVRGEAAVLAAARGIDPFFHHRP